MAVGFRWQGGQASSATINVNSDGTINLITGSVDIGGTRTSVAMQAAEVLGLKAEDVSPSVVDTDTVGYTATTGGSRITFDTGLAAIDAAEEVKRQMSTRAALLWEVQDEDVVFENGTFICTKNSEDRFSFKELAERLMRTVALLLARFPPPQPGSGPSSLETSSTSRWIPRPARWTFCATLPF